MAESNNKCELPGGKQKNVSPSNKKTTSLVLEVTIPKEQSIDLDGSWKNSMEKKTIPFDEKKVLHP